MKKLAISLTLLVALCAFAASKHPPFFVQGRNTVNDAPFVGVGTIVKDAFTVGAGRYVSYPIDVHPRGGRVTGKFRAQGGGGNDIECFIVSEDGLENFGNGHAVPTFYNSGRVTVATVNVVLREGRYHLVFSNKFSAITPKAVNAAFYIQLPDER